MTDATYEMYYDPNDGFGLMYAYCQEVLSADDRYALDIVIDIKGMTTDTIDMFLQVLFGYDFEQFYDKNESFKN